MSLKDTIAPELLPRLTAQEKKIFSTLVNFGASSVSELAERSEISQGRIPTALEKLINRGLIVALNADSEEKNRYTAVFPITRFTKIVDNLSNSLESRKSELQATTQVVNDFTQNAIKNVREASVQERQKRNERSEEDIKDLEMAMDASFSGILASIEMDLKDLGKIAKTSNEFLTESAIRTTETCNNIGNSLKPLTEHFTNGLKLVSKNIEDKLSETVDNRISNVLEFETHATQAFDEVLVAFKESQDAFENIIFTVLDTGITDLEKVTKPINEQIGQAISSLKVAIKDASNNFQTEILRVLLEQKRPMITSMEGLRSKSIKILDETSFKQNEKWSALSQSLTGVIESHSNLLINSIDGIANEFNGKISAFITQIQENIASTLEETRKIENNSKKITEIGIEERNALINKTSNKTKDILNDVMEQFINILNRSIAQYQMNLSDLVTKLETEFMTTVEKNGITIQNLVDYINISLIEPIKVLVKNFPQVYEKIKSDEMGFFNEYLKILNSDLKEIKTNFGKENAKKEELFEKEIERLKNKLKREAQDNQEILTNKLNGTQKDIQNTFKAFSNQHEKELKSTSKEITNLTKMLERWSGNSVNFLTNEVDGKINENIKILSIEINEIIDKIQTTDQLSKDDLIKIVKNSYANVTKSYKGFSGTINQKIRESLNTISTRLKKDSLNINNRFIQFKKEQDKLLDETKIPSFKLIDDISKDYKEENANFLKNIETLLSPELENLKKINRDIERNLEETFNQRNTRTAKEISVLRGTFEKERNTYIKKTEKSLKDVEKTIIKNALLLLDQEKSTRTSISNLIEKIVGDLSNGVNKTAENLRVNLWDGAETIFGQAIAETNKQQTELVTLNDDMKNDLFKQYEDYYKQIQELLDKIKNNTNILQNYQTSNIFDFKEKYFNSLREDSTKKTNELNIIKDQLIQENNSMAQNIRGTIDNESNKAILDLETKTAGIEGAIFSTVDLITAEAARKTEGVVVIGEQAVLDIGNLYTENLEKIRQNLTDEVVSRIEKEAKRIETYKGSLKQIGRNHAKAYGQAQSELNETFKRDLKEVEKTSLQVISACHSISCRFLEELNNEINAMGNRVDLSTERLTKQMMDDFDRVLQKVKREVSLFAKKQFELSNKSNQEIAEAFLKAVDDLEEVMLKQIDSFTKRTTMAIDKTKEISSVVNGHIKDMTSSFQEMKE